MFRSQTIGAYPHAVYQVKLVGLILPRLPRNALNSPLAAKRFTRALRASLLLRVPTPALSKLSKDYFIPQDTRREVSTEDKSDELDRRLRESRADHRNNS